MPAPSQFEAKVSHVKELAGKVEEYHVYVSDWSVKDIPADLDQTADTVDEALAMLPESSHSWLQIVVEDIVAGGERRQTWSSLVSQCQAIIDQWRPLHHDLIQHDISLPEDKEHYQLKQDVQTLKERMDRKKGTGWVFKHITGRKTAYLLEQCNIDQRPVQTEHDCELILKYLHIDDLNRKIALLWNRHMAEVGGPQVDVSEQRFIVTLENHLRKVEALLTWPKKNRKTAPFFRSPRNSG